MTTRPTAPAPAVPRPLTDAERAEIEAFHAHNSTRPKAPRFAALDNKPEHLAPAPDADVLLFRSRLTQALGTTDESAINHLLGHASEATEGGDVVARCNAAAALLAGIQPRNEVEAMLAVQMIAAHNLALAMARRAFKTNRVDWMQVYTSLSAKVMNVYTRQLEALARLRGQTGQQTVHVGTVAVEAGGQAVVGAIKTGGAGQ